MSPNFSDEPTLPVPHNPSSPREIARKHRDDPPDPEHIPDKIGPYRILKILGGGGMGLVYLAEQPTPNRCVAIKIIPPGRRTKEILARFDIEREALALMSHPNIAAVYDAGESDDGRPYFVMEYVHGISITEYCDQNKLSTDQRLELFVDVCRAVHHAHQKGIIHRDIKPGNVLVAVQEKRPIAKVIDFGVAKAVQHRLTQRTLFTEHGQLIGTPGYMSPEQADLSALDIDTRTDIYSLGVLLYELLVGSQPFDTHRLLEAGFNEIQRVIREVDPPKPSTRLSSLGDDSTLVASNRRTVVRSLSRELRGDLDWITMKCLEKDRVRRYDSATALADDVERHMKGMPVEAGPPSTWYKLRKFTRRHRYGVGAGVGIAAALIGGLTTTLVQYARANREWARAQSEAIRAENEAATATEVKDFMIGLFKVSDPSEALGNKVLARDILDSGARQIPKQLESRPLVQAAMMDAIGSVYGNLGLYKDAEDLLRQSLVIRRRELPELHYDTAQSLHHLGEVLDGRGEYQEAQQCHEEGLAICEKLYGRDHLHSTDSLAHLGKSSYNVGRLEDAARFYLEVFQRRQSILPPDDPRLALAIVALGVIDQRNNELVAAEKKYREALSIYDRSSGRDNPDAAECLFLNADIAFNLRNWSESEKLHSEVLAIYERLYGPEDVHVGKCLSNYGNLLAAQDKTDEAYTMASRALAISTRSLGEDHPQTASDLNFMGCVLRDKKEYDEAEQFHRRSLAIRLQNGPDDYQVGVTRANLGLCLTRMGRHADAEIELLEASRIYTLRLPEGHPRRDKIKQRLIELYEAWGKPDRADPYR